MNEIPPTVSGEQTASEVPLTAKAWKAHCYAWQKTSENKTAYCKKHGLKPSQFYYWCGQVLRQQQTREEQKFIAVVGEVPKEKAKVLVELPLSENLHLHIHMPRSELLAFIQELRDAITIIR